MANLRYRTPHLAAYFAAHRRTWDEFYPSERWVFERIGGTSGGFGRVLDVGCAAGGLGRALEEKYPLAEYLGIDINESAIEAARAAPAMMAPSRFACADILDCRDIPDAAFNTVACLSVADWNVETDAIIDACWRRVAPGGRLIISLRLTERDGIRDPETSYQPILPPGDRNDTLGEVENAPYVVFNGREAIARFASLDPVPSDILAYGYWGKPSATAVTPYDRLAFAVLAVTRPPEGAPEAEPRLECHLPDDLFACS